MKFSLLYRNHGEGLFIEDFFVLVRQMLAAVGAEAAYEFDSSLPGRCNVIVESFDADDWARMRDARANGSEWIILASEYVSGDTFNHYPALDGAEQYGDRSHWAERFANFVRCAEYARAVWITVEDPAQVAAYRAVVPPHVPVLPLPFPFCPEVYRAAPRLAKDVDVLFTGTTTPHRIAILSELARHARLFGTRYVPDYLRREFVARTRVCLSMRQSPGWPFPSQLRLWHLLNQGAFVVGERCPVPCGLDPYVVQAEGSVLAAGVLELLRSGQHEVLRPNLIAKYAAERPLGPAARVFFEQTFAKSALS